MNRRHINLTVGRRLGGSLGVEGEEGPYFPPSTRKKKNQVDVCSLQYYSRCRSLQLSSTSILSMFKIQYLVAIATRSFLCFVSCCCRSFRWHLSCAADRDSKGGQDFISRKSLFLVVSFAHSEHKQLRGLDVNNNNSKFAEDLSKGRQEHYLEWFLHTYVHIYIGVYVGVWTLTGRWFTADGTLNRVIQQMNKKIFYKLVDIWFNRQLFYKYYNYLFQILVVTREMHFLSFSLLVMNWSFWSW